MNQKFRFNCKVLCILIPFCIAYIVYISIAKSHTPQPDQLIKIKQNTQYYYIATYNDCPKEFTIQFDNYTRSFELPEQYPFAKTRCQKSNTLFYKYQLQQSTPILSISTKQEILQIISTTYNDDSITLLFNMSGSTILGYDERIQYNPAWFIRTKDNQFYALIIYTSARVQTHYINQFLQVNVYAGQVRIKLFMDEQPEQVIKAFHHYIGGYKLFPFSALGYQYYGQWIDQEDIDYLKYKDIPIQTIWIDDNQQQLQNVNNIQIIHPTIQIDTMDKKYLIKNQNGKSYQGCIEQQYVNYLDYNVKQKIQKVDVMLKKFENYEDCMYKSNIDENAYHYSKKPILLEDKIIERYFHPLNQFAQQLQYSQSLIISEDIFFGSGQFSGQVYESNDLERSITKLIYNNFFGIPYSGTYGCDQGLSTLRWCSRWLSIQAWMPLFVSRSSQQFHFSNHPEYFDQIHNEVSMRIQLSKWMYTQFIKNYDQQIQLFTGTIIQPLWWYNITDIDAYNYEQREFIFGHDFLIAPIIDDPLNDYQTYYKIYFPYNNDWMQTTQQTLFQGGTHVNFNILTYTSTPIFQRSGSIIFRQKDNGMNVNNNVYQLYVVFNKYEDYGNAECVMMTLNNFSQQNIEEKCIKQNCLMKLQIRYEYNKQNNSEHYYLNAQKFNDDTQFERVEIDEINLFHSKLHFSKVINYKVIIDQDLIIDFY